MVHRSHSELNLDTLVFEGRNTAYGAFYIRKTYNSRLRQSLMIVLFTAAASLALTFIRHPKTIESLVPPLPDETIIDITKIFIAPPASSIQNVKPKVAAAIKNPVTSTSKNDFTITNKGPEVNPEVKNPTAANQDPGGNTASDPGIVGTAVENPDSSTTTDLPVEKPSVTPDWVSVMPQFSGGEAALNKFLSRNIHYPEDAVEEGITGVVYVSFVIDSDGQVTDVTLQKGIDKRCDEEALRVVRKMPRWKPGRHNGRAVSVRKTVPIHFKL